MLECLQYLTGFLLGEGNESLTPLVSYGDDGSASLVIEPSGFFSEGVYLTEKSLPAMPLPELEGVPLLFGNPSIREEDGRIFLGADLIASAFFLLTRYEECVRRDVRDQHGRFPGKESLPYRAGFLRRPVVEEYGALLRRLLRRVGKDALEPSPSFCHVWLTHDVDHIWSWDSLYRAVRSAAKRILLGQQQKLRSLRAYILHKQYARWPLQTYMERNWYDPVYTFPWLLTQDHDVQTACGLERCTPLYFFMGCVKRKDCDVGYMENRSRTADMINYLKENGCEIGYHVSYAASLDMRQAKDEIARIQEIAGRPIILSRNHYLASREPEDFYSLLDAGVTDDFTMGYADEAGFRLGTCRPVRWIDPVKRALTGLTLHPMTVMECTLDAKGYMNIRDEEDAFAVVRGLLEEIYRNSGEAVLLWHSPSVDPYNGTYQRSLYQRTLEAVLQLERKEETPS